jgi:hypothetical protein
MSELNEFRKLEKSSNGEVEKYIKERKTMDNHRYSAIRKRDNLVRKYNNQERGWTRWSEFCKYRQRVKAREERQARIEARRAEEEGGFVEEVGEDGEVEVAK